MEYETVTTALQVVTHSEEETIALASKLVAHMSPGDVVVLTGPLGAGKTAFVRGLACGLEIDEETVNSPSFAIVNEYPGKNPIFHFDLYRIGDAEELHEIGWFDYLGRKGLVVVEWGEKADDQLPSCYYRIDFGIVGETDRSIDIMFVGERDA